MSTEMAPDFLKAVRIAENMKKGDEFAVKSLGSRQRAEARFTTP
jgi:hypothetical protein